MFDIVYLILWNPEGKHGIIVEFIWYLISYYSKWSLTLCE